MPKIVHYDMAGNEHRRTGRGPGLSPAAHIRGRQKLPSIAAESQNSPDRPAQPLRPDSSIINESIPVFAIGCNEAGFWVARDCNSSASGLFLSKAGAVRFARRTSGTWNCALMFMKNGLELGPYASLDARAWRSIIPSKFAKQIVRLKLRIAKLGLGPDETASSDN